MQLISITQKGITHLWTLSPTLVCSSLQTWRSGSSGRPRHSSSPTCRKWRAPNACGKHRCQPSCSDPASHCYKCRWLSADRCRFQRMERSPQSWTRCWVVWSSWRRQVDWNSGDHRRPECSSCGRPQDHCLWEKTCQKGGSQFVPVKFDLELLKKQVENVS